MCEGPGLEPQSSQSSPMNFFRGGGEVKAEAKEPAQSEMAVRVKIEGEGLPKPKKGNYKGQQADWRSMTGVCAGVCPTEMEGPLWDLVHGRWLQGKRPEMKVVSWDRQRKAQRMPTEAGSRLEFAKGLC